MDSPEEVLSKPDFSEQLAEAIAEQHFGVCGTAKELPGERDQNFQIVGPENRFVLKIANPQTIRQQVELENAAIGIVETIDTLESPILQKSTSGSNIATVHDSQGQPYFVRCLSFVPGIPLASFQPHSPELLNAIGRALGELDVELTALNSQPAAKRELKWDLKNTPRIVASSLPLFDSQQAALLDYYQKLFDPLVGRVARLPASVIHNDANDYNLLVDHDADRGMALLGLIDFGDLVYATTINDLAICAAYAMLSKSDPISALTALTVGYHEGRGISEDELSVLFPLVCMRLSQSVCISAAQKRVRPDNEYLQITEQAAWQLLNQLRTIDVDAVRLSLSDKCGNRPARHRTRGNWTKQEILSQRNRFVSPSLSLSYDQPLHIVRGQGQYLFDESDVTYLDCVNNVCHVGHCHPKVVEAAVHQLGILNTNTRYLHENLVRYSKRMAETLPPSLEVCFLVNSGSEANDLALRLARAKSGHLDVIVIDHAYHGHTSALIELSPYKFDGPGGSGKPDHVHVISCPDGYRGPFHDNDPDYGIKYAEQGMQVIQSAIDEGRSIAAFFHESLMGCAGQIPLPPGYLSQMYSLIRDCGGVCVADEVQVGLGRVGTHFWGFETSSVVPDIVTMGKPIGNGHPLAAVVTTREIADAFHNGMEYFNTFGGNPVSAAVGLAVLDIIEEEQLQKHALEVGQYLISNLDRVCKKFPCVGNIRGSGLFLGIEMVSDRESREPSAPLAHELVERMKRRRILLSTDGPDRNVIKFKPPMVFSFADAERLVMTLAEELGKLQIGNA